MKKFLFLLTTVMVALSVWAAPVDQNAASKVAKNYLTQEMYAGRIMAPAAVNPVLLKTGYAENAKVQKPVYYIFNTSTTYLVVAGDDRAEEILMVGDAPLEDINNLPLGMIDMLGIYAEQIQFLHEHPSVQVEKISEQRHNSLRAVTYGPLLTAKWDQDAPYWNLCKFTYNGTTYQCYTGCPATSAAMVLYYWKYPASVDALPSYTSTMDIDANNYQGYQTVNYTYPALEATTFDWGNMKDSYSSYTSAQGAAVATLMRYVGQAEGMMYGTAAAGGSGIYVSENYRIADMFKAFGYKSTARNVTKSSYSTTNWNNLLQTELAAGRPLVYCAVSSQAGGHAFNVDGWRDSDSKYHVNWGWSGSGNNWFAMDAFKDTDGYTFNQSQQAIVGVEPPGGGVSPIPVLSVSPTSLSFTGSHTGETYTKTFTVTGTDLSSNVTISSSNALFTVSPSTLTPAQAAAGATVTVTYKPTAAGTHTGTITVASTGATSQTVTVNGSATTVPRLTADPSSLSFNTEVGTPVSQTFTLQGFNLTGIVNLSVSGDGFSINTTAITKTAAMNGYEITVTYSPTSSGTHTGTVTLNSNGATPVTVALTGTATAAPRLTVNPSSLSFNTEVGTPVSKTFTVQGYDLTGIVNLSVSGTGFSINTTAITKTAAMNGYEITVTYSPTSAGTHTGTVTLNSNGAQPVTVALTGTATTVTAINVDPSSLSFNTIVGTPVTKSFTVNASGLSAAVSLSVSGVGFTINKTSISIPSATNGTTVNVTYTPTAAGTHTGTVTLTSNGIDPVTVALNGTATEPVRTITATPDALNFMALVGETKTATFTVTGENLNGPLTLAVDNGIYSVQPSTISVAEATAGKTVTVTYAPTTFGVTSGTITISGGGAPAATVTLNGQADIIKYAPVMLPAIEDYININKFRADWTDATPDANVASYTLEVNLKPVDPVEPEVVELLGTLDGTSYTNQSYQAISLGAPWSVNNLYGGYGAIYFRNATHQSATTDGYIKFTISEGYENKTFTVKLTTAAGQYGAGRFVVGSTQTEAVEYNMSAAEAHSWLVTGSTGDVITITSPEDQFSPDIATLEIYAGNATVAAFRADESQTYRLIEGITEKFCTVENLLEAGTFLYKVKAIYIDGTESEWSNIEEVTLFQNGHGFVAGDVNHDGKLNISDVTALTNYLLSQDETGICTICANVNGDGGVTIADVTALINMLLTNSASQPRTGR